MCHVFTFNSTLDDKSARFTTTRRACSLSSLGEGRGEGEGSVPTVKPIHPVVIPDQNHRAFVSKSRHRAQASGCGPHCLDRHFSPTFNHTHQRQRGKYGGAKHSPEVPRSGDRPQAKISPNTSPCTSVSRRSMPLW